ncbi:MAG: hypothetical protein ACR2HG_10340 [Pyrinomonadaceae bacterium]
MKKQNVLTSIIALALIVFVALACGNSDKKESTSTATTDSPSTDSRSSTTTESDSIVSRGGNLSTPTQSHAAMYQAMKNRDIAAYKKTLAKCYLDTVAGFAKRQNISTDEFIKKSLELVPAASIKTPEVRNEKINGDTATLEEKDFRQGEGWNVATYLKEDGDWKFSALCDDK